MSYKKFIVLGRSRVGSNLLLSLLNSHPNICAYGEKMANIKGSNPIDIINQIFKEYNDIIKS